MVTNCSRSPTHHSRQSHPSSVLFHCRSSLAYWTKHAFALVILITTFYPWLLHTKVCLCLEKAKKKHVLRKTFRWSSMDMSTTKLSALQHAVFLSAKESAPPANHIVLNCVPCIVAGQRSLLSQQSMQTINI